MRVGWGSQLDEEAVRKLVEAGRVAAKAREYGLGLVEAGASAREICERIETFIRNSGAEPAFPCNISINEVAAHYTPGALDDVTIPEGAVVKIDVGAHVDGWIADTAATIDLSGKHGALLAAVREALERVVEAARPYMRAYEVGKIVSLTVKSRGFRVIRNLTGHSIGRYVIHAGLSVPNVPDRAMMAVRFTPGMIVAIEPFATNGKGFVIEGSTVNIYAYTGRKPRAALSAAEEKALSIIVEKYRTLPFTQRWLAPLLGAREAEEAVRGLAAKKALHAYPVLVEAGRGVVAQFEHTLVFLEKEVLVTTKEE